MQLLIAHKEPVVRAALTRAIADGWDGELDVIESAEGEAALELLLQEDSPRLAVVDWDLPGLDGPELCRLVRDFHLGGPPYVILLAAARHPDVQTGLEAGANDCIRTPAHAAEIRERVDAGRRFIEVPWEQAQRSAMLDAVRTRDDDDVDWDLLETSADRDVPVAAAPTPRKAELQALLYER
jgi:DNA-binding response OmpR family regulator